ncbi:MAG: 5-formyltetrahydrofolate cyclo-ligase [Xanthomonadaceae bacterium]|nr:5-formyltetrahydrofolate cyclo-ligase [Xanthomonadaceae bacterium]
MTDRTRLRRDLRRARRALDPLYRTEASLAIARQLVSGLLTRRYMRIAGYVASDAEADPGPFLAAARLRGRRIYLPMLAPLQPARLRFGLAKAGQALAVNRFGIPEPVATPTVAPTFLDLALVPLVGFDDRGNRLGMGAAYYDRTFAFLRMRRLFRKPRLVGVAFDCQRTAQIDSAPWDVPLDGVVTESGLWWFNSHEEHA